MYSIHMYTSNHLIVEITLVKYYTHVGRFVVYCKKNTKIY